MPVFLQFRLWVSQGPVRERAIAGAIAVAAVVVLVLVSLPLADNDNGDAKEVVASGSSTSASGETASASSETAGATVEGGVADGQAAVAGPAETRGRPAAVTNAGAGTRGNAPGVTTPSGAPVTAAACGTRTASAPGISANEVLVGVSIVNLVGPVGNAAFSIRPDLHAVNDAIAADINKTGGVACGRKLVIKQYDVNPIDQNDQQAKCLQMVEDKVFAVLDEAGYVRPVARACFVQNKLPHQLSAVATEEETGKGYPYMYGAFVNAERAGRNGVLGLTEQGFFAAPKFKKLGLLADRCDPSVTAEIERNLAKVGVKPNQISKFTLNCALIGSPTEISAAVVQHRNAGATHVFLAASLSNGQRYTQLAAQQDFRPAYAVSDYGSYTTAAGSWDASFAGALAITASHNGELNTGLRNAELAACDRLLRANEITGIRTEKEDGSASLACDQFRFFRQAIDRAGTNPTRQSFIDAGVSRMGLFKGGSVADGVFDRVRKVVSGDFRRALQFDGGCKCWKLKERAFKPGF